PPDIPSLSLHDALPICSAGAMLWAFSSSSCARRRTWDGPTLMSGRDCNHFAQPEESVKSGAAPGLMLGGSKLDMGSVQSAFQRRSEEHTSELQSRSELV